MHDDNTTTICVLQPGGVFKEDRCTVCQCINNAYVCDDTACNYKSTTEQTERATEPYYSTTPMMVSTQTFTTETEPSTSTAKTTVSSTGSPEETSSVKDVETTTERIVFVPSTVSPPAVLCDSQQ